MSPLPPENITLKVDAEAAKIFNTASSDDKAKLEILVSSLLKEYGKSNPETIKQSQEPELYYEDGVLVFKAEPIKDVNLENLIEDLRQERINQIIS